MSGTVATPQLKQLAADWSGKCGLRSAKLSGIVPDARHVGGYHVGRRFQSASNYSVVRPDDLGGPDDAAAAIDMTLNAADMVLCTGRLVAAYTNLADPRRKYINAFNGTQDGKVARRWDVYARKVKAATKDHLWHVHLEVRRQYVTSASAMKAILSVLSGQSVADYLTSIGASPSAGSVKISSTVPRYPGKPLRRDDQQKLASLSVRRFQEQLIKRGLTSVGSPDGFFGPKLEAAVKQWQRRVGLPVDGIIGPKTWPTPWNK